MYLVINLRQATKQIDSSAEIRRFQSRITRFPATISSSPTSICRCSWPGVAWYLLPMSCLMYLQSLGVPCLLVVSHSISRSGDGNGKLKVASRCIAFAFPLSGHRHACSRNGVMFLSPLKASSKFGATIDRLSFAILEPERF